MPKKKGKEGSPVAGVSSYTKSLCEWSRGKKCSRKYFSHAQNKATTTAHNMPFHNFETGLPKSQQHMPNLLGEACQTYGFFCKWKINLS